MINDLVNRNKGFSNNIANQLGEMVMKSSSTSSWDSSQSLRLSNGRDIGRDALATSSTRELVELYWTNRKRFSGGHTGFPAEVN